MPPGVTFASRGNLGPVTERLRIAIRVKPGDSRPGVGGCHGEALVVRVAPRAVDGKATEAALRAVADALGVPRRDVRLASGQTSRDKVVEVADPPSDVRQVLDRLRSS